MTLDQVIARLEEMRNDIGGDVELVVQDPQFGNLDVAKHFTPRFVVEIEEFGVNGRFTQYMLTEFSDEATNFILVYN